MTTRKPVYLSPEALHEIQRYDDAVVKTAASKVDPPLVTMTDDDGVRLAIAASCLVGVVLLALLLGAWVLWLHMEIVWH